MSETVVRGKKVIVVADSTTLGVKTLDNNKVVTYASPNFEAQLKYQLCLHLQGTSVTVKGKIGELLARAPRMIKEGDFKPKKLGNELIGLRALVVMMGLNDLAAWVNKDKNDTDIKSRIKSAIRSTINKARGYDATLPIIVTLQHQVRPTTVNDNFSEVNSYFLVAKHRYQTYRSGLREVAGEFENVYVADAGAILADTPDRIHLSSAGYHNVSHAIVQKMLSKRLLEQV